MNAEPPASGETGQQAERISSPEVSLRARQVRQRVIAALEATVFDPPRAVRPMERAQAVRLLGQFSDQAATGALFHVLGNATRDIQPRPLGRWLRDIALDTLLRSPFQQDTNIKPGLARYYSLSRRLVGGRLERNIIYDDIPLLAQFGSLGLLLRTYAAPMIVLLFSMVLGAEWLLANGSPLGGTAWLIWLVASLYFVALGLGIYNLHQVLLVLLVSWLGPKLRIPAISSGNVKLAFAAVLSFAGAVLLLASILSSLLYTIPQARSLTVLLLLLMPLLILPCYMLAHDLEIDYIEGGSNRPRFGSVGMAVALRWTTGFVYVAYTFVTYGMSFVASEFGYFGGISKWQLRVLLIGYLVLVPTVVILVLSLTGRLQDTFRGVRRRNAVKR